MNASNVTELPIVAAYVYVIVTENVDAKMVTRLELLNKVPEVVIEVQIMDLKDVYNKKVKKTLKGLEYPLEDSKVTVVMQASDEITNVRAYTQRCPEAAIRTHDTTGRPLRKIDLLQISAYFVSIFFDSTRCRILFKYYGSKFIRLHYLSVLTEL